MLSELSTVGELFTHTGFLIGLGAGVVLIGGFYVASNAGQNRIVGWGLATSIAALVIIVGQFEVEAGIPIALVVVALAGGLVDLTAMSGDTRKSLVGKVIAWIVLAAAVYWFAATTGSNVEEWFPVAYPLVVMVFGISLYALGTGTTAEVAAPMVLVTVAGMWVTIPETDMVRVLLGVALPMALVSLPPIRGRTTAAGAFVLAALISWLALTGGETRPLSVVGGWASIGVIAVLPAMALFRYRPSGRALIFGSHVVYVLAITRVVDNWDSILVALVALVALAIVSGFILASLSVSGAYGAAD